jgi:glycosyltransferase involved in cell wall biosynthesis
MDILFISSFFPPYAPTAATRIGKLTRYFHERGHGVRVLTALNERFPPVLSAELPQDLVTYVPFPDINALPGRVKGFFRGKREEKEEVAVPVPAPPPAAGGGGRSAALSALYRDITNIPDGYVGWYRPAVAEGVRLVHERKPDLLYVSLPLHTGLLVAAGIARRTGVPLVVEYRDLWVEHPYYDAPSWRRGIERRLERRATRGALGYVTVTKGWTDLLKSRRGRPTALVLNGFDPADFPGEAGPAGEKLTILYAGALYENKRDPTPLFAALEAMGEEAQDIEVIFHTPSPHELDARIARFGLEGIVRSLGPIPHKEVIAREMAADLLLLLRWDHPSEKTVVAGKLFEYIGAGRPILSVGLETGEAADIITENGFGIVTKDPEAIARHLRRRLAEKRAGGVPANDAMARTQFSRDGQFAKLETFLEGLTAAS